MNMIHDESFRPLKTSDLFRFSRMLRLPVNDLRIDYDIFQERRFCSTTFTIFFLICFIVWITRFSTGILCADGVLFSLSSYIIFFGLILPGSPYLCLVLYHAMVDDNDIASDDVSDSQNWLLLCNSQLAFFL